MTCDLPVRIFADYYTPSRRLSISFVPHALGSPAGGEDRPDALAGAVRQIDAADNQRCSGQEGKVDGLAGGSGSFAVLPPALALSITSMTDRKNRRRFSSSTRS